MNKRTLILTGAAILLMIAAVFSVWKEKQDLLTDFYGDPPRDGDEAQPEPEAEPKKPRSKKSVIVESETAPADGTTENQ